MRFLEMAAVVLCVASVGFSSETYDPATKTLTVTADSLAATVDPLGQGQDYNPAVLDNYQHPAMTKGDFNALAGLKTITFNGNSVSSIQACGSIIAYCDATNYVTFDGFGSAVTANSSYKYNSGTTEKKSHSGAHTWDMFGTGDGTLPTTSYLWLDPTAGVAGHNWYRMEMTVSDPTKGVTALGFIVDARDTSGNQTGAGKITILFTDNTTVQMDYGTFGGAVVSGQPTTGPGTGLFFGYQAPSGKFIKRVECTRKNGGGNSILGLDDLTFVLGQVSIPGDVDGDGHVDVVDLLYLVDSFGWSLGDPAFDPRCDFNSDDSVDVVDLLTLVENFGLY